MNHDIDKLIDRLREGDDVRVQSFKDIGPNIVTALDRVKRIHAKGGCFTDRKGRRTDRVVDLVDMMTEDMPGMRKGLTPRKAAANGKKGGRKPNERTAPEIAKPIWIDPGIRTNKRALQMPEMKGWYQKLAYDVLGPSGRPTNKITTRRKAKRR